MRQLKHHEKKLLKKVDFLRWKTDDSLREVKIVRRYHIQNRADYVRYNKICGQVKKIANKLKDLDARDTYRIKTTDALIEKLYVRVYDWKQQTVQTNCISSFNMGVITSKKSLSLAANITASAFCRRRLPVVMVRLKMSESIREAVTFIEQGHVRVGPETVSDPAFLVNRSLEDFVTWTDQSKIRRHVFKYNDKLDDYDLLGN